MTERALIRKSPDTCRGYDEGLRKYLLSLSGGLFDLAVYHSENPPDDTPRPDFVPDDLEFLICPECGSSASRNRRFPHHLKVIGSHLVCPWCGHHWNSHGRN